MHSIAGSKNKSGDYMWESESDECSYNFVQAKGEQVVEAKVIGDDLRHWRGKIFGPVSGIDKAAERHSLRGRHFLCGHLDSS